MAMLNPCNPDERLRENMEATELSVTEAESRLGYTRQTLSRLLNTAAGGLRTGAGTAWDKSEAWRWVG